MNNNHISDNLQDEIFPDCGIDEFEEPIIYAKLPNVGGKLPSENEALARKNKQRIVSLNSSGIRPEKINNSVKASKVRCRIIW